MQRAQVQLSDLKAVEPKWLDNRKISVNDVLIDFKSCTIKKHLQSIHIAPLTMELLTFFVDNPGVYISCEMLMQKVWCGRHVTNNAVRIAVKKLRDAFSDDFKNPSLIKTVPNRGYLFIGDIKVLEDEVVVEADQQNARVEKKKGGLFSLAKTSQNLKLFFSTIFFKQTNGVL
ncbi:MAG: winged helix-turn-helix domain-containing protein [Psychrosphaera sp.]|nr:winged helix-turn-helix domain-containing protein [Psychrosphaera sp.]